ncbi:uncharacterized protein V1518DRAFT_417426 [Limtongia smithiae]|uniref:uncharacterized protein n=1 Tax=Limtongia smithiae TaxID=1125753 RepID=UPI0034CDC03C
MVTVAIAGSSGHIGLTLFENLKRNSALKVIGLSRVKPSGAGDSVYVVDYNDIDALAQILRDNAVEIVISAIQVSGPEAGASEQNLVNAAVKADSVVRFVSSDWGIPFPADQSEWTPQHIARAATRELLATTSLEWTTFHIGYIADYFGIPYIETHMSPLVINIDIANKAAAIPGTGNDLIAFTYSHDVAKFVEAALNLPHWDDELFCYGDRCTLNQVVKLAQGATASAFAVTYDSVEKLRAGQISELPSHYTAYPYFPKPVLQMVFAKFGTYVVSGLFNFPEDKCLNNIFPEINTKSVKEIVAAWKGK